MVVGFFQSLVLATPGNIGPTFLRLVYEDLDNLTVEKEPQTKEVYFCEITLSKQSRLCFQWWIGALSLVSTEFLNQKI